MANITGKFGSNFAETIKGTAENDNIWPLGGFDVVDGGAGIDTVFIEAPHDKFQVLNLFGTYYVDTVSGASAVQDQTTLKNVERLAFSDGMVALDMGATQAGGESALLMGAVLGKGAVSTQPVLVGALLQLFDAGVSLHDLSAYLMSGPDLWRNLAGGSSNVQIATYLLTNVNGHAPTAAELDPAVAAMAASPADFLANLALSAANQKQVNLVGLQEQGLAFLL